MLVVCRTDNQVEPGPGPGGGRPGARRGRETQSVRLASKFFKFNLKFRVTIMLLRRHGVPRTPLVNSSATLSQA